MRTQTFLMWWLLLASVAFGQTQAVINGPESALPGELVVLNSNDSVGESHRWIVPSGISTAQAGCDPVKSQVFFATPREGKYKFILIVADKEATIEFAEHTVEIKSIDAPPPPPTDPDPTDPVDPPPPDTALGQLTKLSRDNSVRLNDAATRKALADSMQIAVNDIKRRCDANQCPTIAAAQSQVIQSIESVLLRRQGVSRDVPWDAGWRSPNNGLIRTMRIESSKQYAAVIQAIIDGLR